MKQKLEICQGDPQNSGSERVTIAERQGASENMNFEVYIDADKSQLLNHGVYSIPLL